MLKVSPEEAEVWDGPGRLVATAKMLAAAATNTRPEIGEVQKVQM